MMDQTENQTPTTDLHHECSSLAMLTDLYQLTMAFGYWKLGRSEQRSIFHLFFRTPPFSGGYAIAAGLEQVVEFIQNFRFTESDVEFLAQLKGNDGRTLFDEGFMDYLSQLRLTVDIDAMPEGSVAFGHEPLLRIEGPLAQCQLLETPLLNLINFQTLIATKATRIVQVAGDDPVLEFGLRRAQGVDGAMSASRAAYIGGCSATSNVLAGKKYGIPVKGTHAHSWVMSFDDEEQSFESYSRAMPNNCVFLVDTYDTIQGVNRAVAVAKRLRQRGHELLGIRLDSGDLAQLSIEARKILDREGFPKAAIVASNDLDEYAMTELRERNAQVSIWGVGTKLATAYDQPALGGVYKLGAMQDENALWQYCFKRSEEPIKTSIPGKLQVRRHMTNGRMVGDVIWDQLSPEVTTNESGTLSAHNIATGKLLNEFDSPTETIEMLRPVFREGKHVSTSESLQTLRDRTFRSLDQLQPQHRSLTPASHYPTGIESGLFTKRESLLRDRT